MAVGLHAEPVTCDATHDRGHHPQRAAYRRGADAPEFRGIRWRPLGDHNACTPSSGTSLRAVFPRLINAFFFSPEFGRWQRSKHPTADRSRPKTPLIPAPISRQKPSGIWMMWCRVPCGTSPARHIIIPSPVLSIGLLGTVKRQNLTPEPETP